MEPTQYQWHLVENAIQSRITDLQQEIAELEQMLRYARMMEMEGGK